MDHWVVIRHAIPRSSPFHITAWLVSPNRIRYTRCRHQDPCLGHLELDTRAAPPELPTSTEPTAASTKPEGPHRLRLVLGSGAEVSAPRGAARRLLLHGYRLLDRRGPGLGRAG